MDAEASTQPAANGAIRSNAGALRSAAPPRNLALAQVSLTAIVPVEPRLIQVNDLITVIVRHRLRYQSEARNKQESEWDVQSQLDAWFRFHDHRWVQQDFERGTPEISFRNQNDLENKGRADRKDIFETRVMAKVLDVKPNGNLIIVARSRVKIGEEAQLIQVTGECNKDDIGPDGSILSDKVFALEVLTENEGSMQDVANRGWLKRFLDEVKPF